MNKITGIVISVDGQVRVVEFEPTLENLQQQIGGGFIEAHTIYDCTDEDNPKARGVIYIDEDGISKKLAENKIATMLCEHVELGLHLCDYIKGTMLIVGTVDYHGNDTSISDELREDVLNYTTFYIVNDGDIFEGLADHWRDCFFDNAEEPVMIDWCRQHKYKLTKRVAGVETVLYNPTQSPE